MKDYEILTLELRRLISSANLADKINEKDALRFIETLYEIENKLKDC